MSGHKDTLKAGVIGVGEMGRHHARVYAEMQGVELAGVSDVDSERASKVADQHQSTACGRAELLDLVDVVSVAVPTEHHYEVSRDAIDRGVHLLVEKPFVSDRDRGVELIGRARAAGLTLQLGHVERFNPAVAALSDVIQDLDLIAMTADRLGPPLDRNVEDGVMLDLMLHDIDILLSVVDGMVDQVAASSARDEQYAAATIEFDTGLIATLTASRMTQQKVRELSITAAECQVNLDYAEQSIKIHRQSAPAYIESDGDVHHRHESVTERLSVSNAEPLKRELGSFVDAVRSGRPPIVDGEDGLRALALAERIQSVADERRGPSREVPAK
jgi:predicted dehydrogenase